MNLVRLITHTYYRCLKFGKKNCIKMFDCMAVLDRQIRTRVLHGSKLRTLFLFLLDTAMCRVYGAYLKNIVHLSILNQKRLQARR